ncbi:MAG: hypothetical protein NMNS01_12020 [Nitrosomonas sp.]|nr:MAG: hypothetical protein NMNS01_12020 [Nitrosomonas sp.]
MNDDDNGTKKTMLELPSYFAYYVEESHDNKNRGQIIGVAYPTNDGGLSLQLTVRPFKGDIILRSRESLQRMRADQEKKLLQFMYSSQ